MLISHISQYKQRVNSELYVYIKTAAGAFFLNIIQHSHKHFDHRICFEQAHTDK